MLNPFDEIFKRFDGLESKIAEAGNVPIVTPPEIIDRDELCRRLDITEPTVIRWEKKGKIPCFRIGSSVRYNWPVVINVLEGKSTHQ